MKVGRNEPCPCGSGKKYKKCCEKKTETLDTIIQQEILDLQADIVRFAYANYDEELKRIKTERLPELKADRETVEAFDFYLTVWALCCSPIKNEKLGTNTILETYIAKNKQLIQRPKLRAMLETWKGIAPSMYRTISMNDDVVTVKNIFTEELYEIKLLTDEHIPEEEGLIIGTLAPYENGKHIFFTAYLDFPKDEADELTDELKKIFAEHKEINPQEYIKANFQDVLYFVLVAPMVGHLAWDDEAQKMVAEGLMQQPLSEAAKETALYLWHMYCQRRKVRIRNSNIYVAALYYLVSQVYHAEQSVTQKELAERFSISVSSLSSRYRDMQETLASELKELTETREAAVSSQQ
jgi:uncharacterized protein YecA (UPF0149 family)